jgi:hypothetical protein
MMDHQFSDLEEKGKVEEGPLNTSTETDIGNVVSRAGAIKVSRDKNHSSRSSSRLV